MILGLYGDSRAGKDTIAKIAYVKRGFEWRSFAAPLREILLMVNPYIVDDDGDVARLDQAVRDFGWDGVKKHYPQSVDMMIGLGQGVRDLIHVDAWIWGVMHDPIPKNMVISDVRQPNEYDSIIAAGGEVWKIIRPGSTRRAMDGLLDDKFFPVTIFNDGDHDALENIVCEEIDRALQDRWNRPRIDDGTDSVHNL